MKTRILRIYQDVKPYIGSARECADLHKNELGFLTPSAYEEQALQNKLWVCIDEETKSYLGHLLFGGKYPYLKIFQLVIQPKHRKEMIPFCLMDELIKFGTENSFLNITARVADELPANKFWNFVGLKLIRQVEGGKARGRKINIRSKELETESLLSLIESHKRFDFTLLSYSQGPVLAANQYVIDVNIFLDITKSRAYRKQASAIVRAGLNNYIKIAVTKEFVDELKRATSERETDPILEFACELPVIRGDNKSLTADLIDDLRRIIFPGRSLTRVKAAQDNSDLIHIATCIASKSTGFITREKAIIRAKDEIFSKYDLEILTPTDIEEPEDTSTTEIFVSDLSESCGNLHIQNINDSNLPKVLRYLSGLRLKQVEVEEILSSGTTGAARQRIALSHNGAEIGVASWNTPSNLAREITAFLLIAEENPVAEKAIDHVLESITRDINSDVRKISLRFMSDQTKTKSTAILRGFRTLKAKDDTILASMVKISFSGFISSDSWISFARKFKAYTNISLPEKQPICGHVDDKCLDLLGDTGFRFSLSFFELETLISPGILLHEQRKSILLPIQPRYALELGICEPKQQSFLAKQEAFLCVEKAYFRKNINPKIYERGMILFFYVSKTGELSRSVIGCARITYSDVISTEEASKKFYRQGVLPQVQLSSLADKNKLIHVITFDNFYRFQNRISLSTLRDNNHVSRRNLITGEVQTPTQTKAILQYAFK